MINLFEKCGSPEMIGDETMAVASTESIAHREERVALFMLW
jgi:hypothetical protein